VNRCGLSGSAGTSGTTGPLNSNVTPPTGVGMDGVPGGFARLPLVNPSSLGL